MDRYTVYIFQDPAKELGFYSPCEEKPQISYKTALAVREIKRGQQSGSREVSWEATAAVQQKTVWKKGGDAFRYLESSAYKTVGLLSCGTETQNHRGSEHRGMKAEGWAFIHLIFNSLKKGKHLHCLSTSEVCFVLRLSWFLFQRTREV